MGGCWWLVGGRLRDQSTEEKCMPDAKELGLLNRTIAADLLVALINNGKIKLGATERSDVVVPATAAAYRELLEAIDRKKSA
jgi:hypothetical protein